VPEIEKGKGNIIKEISAKKAQEVWVLIFGDPLKKLLALVKILCKGYEKDLKD
jgi:hypothetical protein